MVLGRDVAFGVEVYASRSRETVFQPGGSDYRLICLPLQTRTERRAGNSTAAKRRQQGPQPLWEQRLGIRVTAMIRAADVVFVGGSPDVIDPDDPHGAWEGRKGGLLVAFAAADGQELARYQLPAPPVWDGMAATSECLLISTSDGAVLCMKPTP
jgi:hypothetical protein